MGKTVEMFFKRYQYMPLYYADKIYDTHKISFERKDVVQELNIRLYKGIISYGKKWAAYKKTGQYKPVHIEYYLKFCMNNRLKDLMKKIDREKTVYQADYTMDIGKSTTSTVDFFNNRLIINDFDILANITDVNSKKVFKMFLKGYPVHNLKRVFKNKNVDVSSVINNQIGYLKENRDALFERNPTFIYTVSREE